MHHAADAEIQQKHTGLRCVLNCECKMQDQKCLEEGVEVRSRSSAGEARRPVHKPRCGRSTLGNTSIWARSCGMAVVAPAACCSSSFSSRERYGFESYSCFGLALRDRLTAGKQVNSRFPQNMYFLTMQTTTQLNWKKLANSVRLRRATWSSVGVYQSTYL